MNYIEWEDSTIYQLGDRVVYEGQLYESQHRYIYSEKKWCDFFMPIEEPVNERRKICNS